MPPLAIAPVYAKERVEVWNRTAREVGVIPDLGALRKS
jgi:hypothetical protein